MGRLRCADHLLTGTDAPENNRTDEKPQQPQRHGGRTQHKEGTKDWHLRVFKMAIDMNPMFLQICHFAAEMNYPVALNVCWRRFEIKFIIAVLPGES